MNAKSNDREPRTLLPLPVAVDLIRFEKNLLQIGFFGAHDTRHRNQSTRRIEQWMNRNGQKIRVAAEFRGSEELGLPSTSDRDKYIAFMKIAMEQKTRFGKLENPVRFTGYHMLKEQGLSFSGENYEDINRWGQRMADTSITSEQVIYLAARKKYTNKTVHVFRSFTRAGQSNTDDTGRAEAFEVVLEEWLLENLNQSYVIPEDFTAYRALKRPTAKGIFGYLHLWFHASQGRAMEKDYAELCMLLNIPVYRHLSKIKETMGRSLDELVEIRYLSAWDIKPMLTKPGYKLVLGPGEELLHVLAISRRKQLGEPVVHEVLSFEQQRSLQSLTERGISPHKAAALVTRFSPNSILDQIEYAEFLLARDRRKRIDNPAGFIIYVIENQIQIPANFPTSRSIQEQNAMTARAEESELARLEAEQRYRQYIDDAIDQALKTQYPGDQVNKKIAAIISHCKRTDEAFEKLTVFQQRPLAERMLRREIQDTLPFPTFAEWCASKEQLELFPSK